MEILSQGWRPHLGQEGVKHIPWTTPALDVLLDSCREMYKPK